MIVILGILSEVILGLIFMSVSDTHDIDSELLDACRKLEREGIKVNRL